MTQRDLDSEHDGGLTRRQVVRGALAGGAMLSAGGLLAACGGGGGGSSSASSSSTVGSSPASTGTIKAGGQLSVGATGGGAKDTIDAHLPTADPDIMRCWNLYEPLAVRPPSFGPLEMMVASSIEAEHGKADSWVVTVRDGIEFHNGKTVTPEDVVFSLNRIIDPKNPKVGAASIGYVDIKGVKKISKNQVRIPLKFANAGFLDDIGQYFNAIVPVGYDPAKPVGTGAFMFESFTPGQQTVFKKFPNYWQHGKPYVDQLTIIDFTDDTARVNALLGGQVQAIDNLPTGQIQQIKGNSSLKVLISETGQWQPFTMRIDQAPFNDVRVRQAMRLIVNRPQMVEQVLSGQGRIANDMYSPFDPAFDSSLPQRAQDIDAGQVAAQGRRPRRPVGAAGDRSGVQRRRPGGRGVRPAGDGRRRQGEPAQARHGHVLRAQLPQVDVRPGLLGHARVPAAGRPGFACRAHRSTRPTGAPASSRP